jgi:hypothetical protein
LFSFYAARIQQLSPERAIALIGRYFLQAPVRDRGSEIVTLLP